MFAVTYFMQVPIIQHHKTNPRMSQPTLSRWVLLFWNVRSEAISPIFQFSILMLTSIKMSVMTKKMMMTMVMDQPILMRKSEEDEGNMCVHAVI